MTPEVTKDCNLSITDPICPSAFAAAMKRALDLVLVSAIVVLLAPVMAAIWLAVRLSSPGPAMIVQSRIGRGGVPFDFYKFRSMYVNNDDASHRAYVQEWIQNRPANVDSQQATGVFKLVGDARITPVGRFLRRFSLDELPQVFNVLKGDMSLVGPRPALPYEVEHYEPWHMRRFDGVPGISGAWQVGGRNRLSFDDMVRLDIEYLRRPSLFADLKILVLTIPAVFRGTGH